MKKILVTFLFPLLIFSQDEYSLNFNGYDSELNLGNPDSEWDDLSNFSVMCWAKFEDNPLSTCGLVSNNLTNNYGWWITVSENLGINFGGAASLGSGNAGNYFATDYVWEEALSDCWITGVFQEVLNTDGSPSYEVCLYVNGDSVSAGYYNKKITHPNDLIVGRKLGDQYFNGSIDHLSFFSSALSVEQIQQYINCPEELLVNIPSNELLGYYNFEEIPDNAISTNVNIVSETADLICFDSNNNENDEESNSNGIIGDLNCDGDVDYLDAYILENLILGVGDTAEELSDQYPCLNENLNGLTNETIESLEEVVEAISTSTNNNGFSNGFNIKFPQGYNGKIINWKQGGDYFDDTYYVVPEDSVLYITNGFINADPIAIGNGTGGLLVIANDAEAGVLDLISSPVILKENDFVYGGNVSFNGLLFPKSNQLTPVFNTGIDEIGNADEHHFHIPEDSILILNTWDNVGIYIQDNNNQLIEKHNQNSTPQRVNLYNPIIIGYPEVVVAFPGGAYNGYLVHRDYFPSSGFSSANLNTENTNDELLNDIQESYFHNGVFNYWESLPMDISAGDSIAEFIVPEGKYMRIKQIGGSGYSNIRLKRDGVLYSENSPIENTDPLPLQGLNYIVFHENDSIYISLPIEANVGYITIMYYLYDMTDTNIEPIYQVLSYPASFTIEPGKKLIVTQNWGQTMLTSDDFDNGNNNLLTIPYSGLSNMSFNSNIQISANENSTIIFNGYLIDD